MKSSPTILDRCVNLAIGGQPFSLFVDPDMQEILRNAMANMKETATINSVHVRNGVSKKALEFRLEIIRRLKGRRISLSADFGKRNGVDFLGRFSKKYLDDYILKYF